MGNFQPFHQPPEKCEHGVKPELCVLCERQSQQQFSHELGKFGVGGPEELPKEAPVESRKWVTEIPPDPVPFIVTLSQSDVDRIAEAVVAKLQEQPVVKMENAQILMCKHLRTRHEAPFPGGRNYCLDCGLEF